MAKIFINPGHMIGVDSGAVNSKYNVTEAEIVMNVGKLVEKYLTVAGCEVKLLQSDNLTGENPTYPNVCRTANQWTADLFISLHCNSAGIDTARGTEVFVYNRWSRAEELAGCIQKQIVNSLNTLDRGVKENRHLGVLRETVMPAVLVELAFINNESDCRLLMDKQDEFARAVARGVTDFLSK